MTGEVRLYEAMPGTRPGHLDGFEDEADGAGELEELTPETATLLLNQPGLGRRFPPAALPLTPGRRFFRLVVPGRVLRRRRPRLVLRLDAAAPQPTLRLHLRLGERSSDVLAGHLTRQAFPDALAAVTRLVGPVVRRHLAGRLLVRLRRALGAGRGTGPRGGTGEPSRRGHAAGAFGPAAGVAPRPSWRPSRTRLPGITLTFVFTFADRAALADRDAGRADDDHPPGTAP